jgi:uncharacterized protein (DUF362 family)
MNKVSYIKSDDRRYNIERCLSLVKADIIKGLRNAKKVVIKPDCHVLDNQLACTHVDTIETLLQTIAPYVKGQITLAEGSTRADTLNAFEEYDYLKLREIYDLAIVDLKDDETENIFFESQKGFKSTFRVSKTLLNSDYIISIASPKIHSKIVFTGTTNNIIYSSLFATKNHKKIFPFRAEISDRIRFYLDQNAASGYVSTLRKKFKIKLALLDAFEAMQKSGPFDGQLLAAHFAIAGVNASDVDALACKCFGLEPVDYLDYGTKMNNLFVAGDDWQDHIIDIQGKN